MYNNNYLTRKFTYISIYTQFRHIITHTRLDKNVVTNFKGILKMPHCFTQTLSVLHNRQWLIYIPLLLMSAGPIGRAV